MTFFLAVKVIRNVVDSTDDLFRREKVEVVVRSNK